MNQPPTLPANGFLYVAFGRKHTLEALASSRSLRRFNSDACIAVVTDQAINDSVFDHVIHAEPPSMSDSRNCHVKIAGLRRSPFERTVFLDTDTRICDDLTNLFSLMDRFDLLVTLNTWRVDRLFEEQSEPYVSVPLPFIACNTGFLGFARRSVVEALFDAWAERMERQIVEHNETNDQPAFRWALYHSAARYCVLSNAHNYQAHNPCLLPGYQTLAVLHDRRPLMGWYADRINQGSSKRPRIMGHLSWRLVMAYGCYATAGYVRSGWARVRRIFGAW